MEFEIGGEEALISIFRRVCNGARHPLFSKGLILAVVELGGGSQGEKCVLRSKVILMV